MVVEMTSPTSARHADSDPGLGLTTTEAEARARAGRSNASASPASRSLAGIVRANLITRFNILLGTLAVLAIIIGPIQDALFGLVLVANAGIGIVQELRAKRTLDRLELRNRANLTVHRDGARVQLAPTELVEGDVVELGPGDQVPADVLVLRADGLEIDASQLTGEAEPVLVAADEGIEAGSFVVAGNATAELSVVGAQSALGRVERAAGRYRHADAELRRATDRVLQIVSWTMVPIATALVVRQLTRAETWRDAARGSIAGVVAMVPEGIVLLTSMVMALAAIRLARRGVLVSDLAAVETLARVDVVCTDKTGTLTHGRPRVIGIEPVDGGDLADVHAVLAALVRADPRPNATLTAIGEATADVDVDFTDPAWTATVVHPFSSARRWSGATFADRGSWLLGAPEVIDPGWLIEGTARTVLLARVIADEPVDEIDGHDAFATGDTASGDTAGGVPRRLSVTASVRLAEALRADAGETIAYLGREAVAVKLLSGDAPATVAALAERAGVQVGAAMQGADLPADGSGEDGDGRTDGRAALVALAEGTTVFGRMGPTDKSRVIEALQSAGHTVAMVGDGVNDVVALRAADLAIAMGSGTPASRAVAHLTLLDDRFAALPDVIVAGRRVLANVERSLALFLTKSVYAAVLAATVAIAGTNYPLLPRQVTLVGALTIGIPGFVLTASQHAPPYEPGLLRRVAHRAVPAGIVAAIAAFVAYVLARQVAHADVGVARTVVCIVLLGAGLGVIVALAGPRRWQLLAPAMGMLAVAAFALPLSRRIFALELPTAKATVVVIVAAGVVGALSRTVIIVASRTLSSRAERHLHS